MRYIVSLSGGTASAVAAERAIVRYGRRNVLLWFADTAWEDEDLYRSKAQTSARRIETPLRWSTSAPSSAARRGRSDPLRASKLLRSSLMRMAMALGLP